MELFFVMLTAALGSTIPRIPLREDEFGRLIIRASVSGEPHDMFMSAVYMSEYAGNATGSIIDYQLTPMDSSANLMGRMSVRLPMHRWMGSVVATGADSEFLNRYGSVATRRFHQADDGSLAHAELVVGQSRHDFEASCLPDTIVHDIPMFDVRVYERLSQSRGNIFAPTSSDPSSKELFIYSINVRGQMGLSETTIRVLQQQFVDSGSDRVPASVFWEDEFTNCDLTNLANLDFELIGYTVLRLFPEDYVRVLANGNCALHQIQAVDSFTTLEMINFPHMNVRIDRDRTYSICESRD